jgi:methionyl-tRNA formyltransferase
MDQSFAIDPKTGLRILFAGSPAIALPSLRMIADGAKAGRWVLVGVLTNPDKPKGRGSQRRTGDGAEPTDIGREAELLASRSLLASGDLLATALLKPETLKEEARKAVAVLKADLLVSFAYGRMFGPKFLSLFPLGGINVHPSLLPKYRGASPIQEAILHQDTETGVTIQRIAAELDSGNIIAQEKIPLNGTETAAALTETAGTRGAALLREVLERTLTTGTAALEGTPQQGEPSYCRKIEKDSGVIDWNRSSTELSAQIRAYNPWPLARTAHNGQILAILEAQPYLPATAVPSATAGSPTTVGAPCTGQVLGIDKKFGILIQTGDGVLAVSLLQYQTKKVLPWNAFINGARDFIGSLLGGGF